VHAPYLSRNEVSTSRVQKNPGFFTVFWCWALLFFWDFFYLNEQLRSLLVDIAHQLSFYLDSSVVQYLLVVRSCKHVTN